MTTIQNNGLRQEPCQSLASGDWGVPTITCPKCGAVEQDHDGFGFLYCTKCRHCTHPGLTDGKCDLCGEVP